MRNALSIGGLGLAGIGVAGALAVATRRKHRIELAGRVAVVTGGGRGLGLAITRELVRRGCRVAICGRDGDVIRRCVEELEQRGADIFGQVCDAADPGQVRTFMDAVLERHGQVDILVNNAGQCFVGPAAELRPTDMQDAMRNVFWVHYHPTMALLPHMRRRGFGRIANITSIGGKLPIPHQAAYVAAKYAATGWSQTLAIELAKEGIRVSTITPPPLRNGAPMHVHVNGRAEQELGWFTRALTARPSAISADRTARVVADAIEHGDRERAVAVISWLATRVHGAAPNLVSRWLAWVDARLPPAAEPGATSRMRLGAEVVATSSDPKLAALAERARADEARYLPESAPLAR